MRVPRSCPVAGPLALPNRAGIPTGDGALHPAVPANDCSWGQPHNPPGSAGSPACQGAPIFSTGHVRLRPEDRGVAIGCPVGGPTAQGYCAAPLPTPQPVVPAKETRAGGGSRCPFVGGGR